MADPAPPPPPALGLFGGSFDPVHLGHLAMARAARDARALPRVLWMVARASPLKMAPAAPADARLALVRLAIAGEAAFEASELELRRRGASYTIDTVRALEKAHPGAAIHLVLGSDSLPDLHRWKKFEDLLERVTPLIAPRTGFGRGRLPELTDNLGAETVARLEAGWLPMAEVAVSSTEIRGRVAQGKDVSKLVAAPVLAEIRARGLYGTAP